MNHGYAPSTRYRVRGLLIALLLTACSDSNRAGSDGGIDVDAGPPRERFSFFVTSLSVMQELSGSPSGFGGDLRFGETGPGAGLRGADKICSTIAERSLTGASTKSWRAFLSATAGADGRQVNAIDRIGSGPWYDRVGRLVASSKTALIGLRPMDADPAIVDDLPNEEGVPNHTPDPAQGQVDNHDTLTGTNDKGELYGPTSTCSDWTSSVAATSGGRPRVGHSWIRMGGFFPGGGPGGAGGAAPPPGGMGTPGFPGSSTSRPPGFPPGCRPPWVRGDAMDGGDADGGADCPFPPGGIGGPGGNIDGWMSSLDEAGCGAGVSIIEMGPPRTDNPTVGSGGGYGGIYCFALEP